MERLEWERQITSSRPELEHAEGTALAPRLTPEVRASLRQLFATVVERRTYLVASGDSEIEVALDRGEILSGQGRRPISELELELKRGETKDLFSLARTFAQALPLRLAVKTKAERGYELVEGGTHEVEKAADIDIKPDMASAEAFRAIAHSCLRQVIVNEPAMSKGQAEGLHQMRIGLRRLRAAIAIFGDVVADEQQEKIEAELKWITRELGPARDFDVLVTDVLNELFFTPSILLPASAMADGETASLSTTPAVTTAPAIAASARNLRRFRYWLFGVTSDQRMSSAFLISM